MTDYAISGITKNKQVRAYAALTTSLVQELQQRHQTFPVVTAALGRTATAVACMGQMLKEEFHRVAVSVEGDGPIGKILAEADGIGNVRGMVANPSVLLPLNAVGKLDVATAVGKGHIVVRKDLGLKEPYQGNSPIVSGELGEDFTYYFTASEQTPSSVGLGVLVNRETVLVAGGFILQVMPDIEDETIQQLEERLAQFSSVTQYLSEGHTIEEMLKALLGEDMTLLEKKPIQFSCTCSRKKTRQVLQNTGKEELSKILQELGFAEVICNLCNEKYRFPTNELEAMIEECSDDSRH